MMRAIGLVLLLVLAGCARVPYDATEKALLGAAIGGQVADGLSTHIKLGEGCHEANPVFGGDVSDGTIIATKVGVGGLIWLISNQIDDHAARKTFLGAASIFGFGIGAYNMSVECGE